MAPRSHVSACARPCHDAFRKIESRPPNTETRSAAYLAAPPAASPAPAAAFLASFSASALASLRERVMLSGQRARGSGIRARCGAPQRSSVWQRRTAQRVVDPAGGMHTSCPSARRLGSGASAARRRTVLCAAAESARPSRSASVSGCASKRGHGRCRAVGGAQSGSSVRGHRRAPRKARPRLVAARHC